MMMKSSLDLLNFENEWAPPEIPANLQGQFRLFYTWHQQLWRGLDNLKKNKKKDKHKNKDHLSPSFLSLKMVIFRVKSLVHLLSEF